MRWLRPLVIVAATVYLLPAAPKPAHPPKPTWADALRGVLVSVSP
jgi:hypothetical protein